MKKIITLILSIMMLGTVALAAACEPATKEPQVKVINVNLTEEEYAFVMKKGNTDLKQKFDTFLAKIEDNGTFDALLSKYFEGEGEKTGYAVTTDDVANSDSNLIVVTNCPFEPFEYLGTDGKIYGLDIEIAALFAQEYELELVIKNIAFDAIFTQVDAGYADVGMAGITISEDRVGLYEFSTAYYNASQKLIVKADNTAFDNCTTAAEVETVIASLEGKTFGYQTGTTGGMYVEGDEDWGYTGFANLTGKGYANAQLAALDLVNGNIFAVVVDDAPAAAIEKAMNN
ncbi:MAG: transporter substrate-binding domain-containing protein [Clostridia bacterium]|nr:transporter substrate-binding domain-containing protein [Clostridia bacterium]